MGTSQRLGNDIAILVSEQRRDLCKAWQRYSVREGYWLPAVNFSITEAMAMVIGARLMFRLRPVELGFDYRPTRPEVRYWGAPRLQADLQPDPDQRQYRAAELLARRFGCPIARAPV